jgi:hypothetical protein
MLAERIQCETGRDFSALVNRLQHLRDPQHAAYMRLRAFGGNNETRSEPPKAASGASQ